MGIPVLISESSREPASALPGPGSRGPVTPAPFSCHENTTLGYRMQYPSDMIISTVPDASGTTAGETFSDPGRHLYAEVTRISGVTTDLHGFIDTVSRDLSGNGYAILSLKQISLDTLPAVEIIMSYTGENERYILLAVCSKKNTHGYILAFGSKAETYEDYAGTFRDMIDSFAFT